MPTIGMPSAAQGEELHAEPSASASPFAASPSVTTRICVPISGTSAAMKPWITEIDRTPSLPSSALIRSTKERIGSRLVGSTSIIRQSKVEMTGLISPRGACEREVDDMLAALDEIGVRELLEGGEDVGRGDPLRGQMAVRVELGGDRGRPGPTIARTRASRSPSQSS